jgi:hypothetical protein
MAVEQQGKAAAYSESPAPEPAAMPLEAISPLSALISRHMLQDGEIVELVVRPSPWWLVLSSWRTLLLCAVIILAGLTFAPGPRNWYVEVGLLGGLARLMWATVKWMSRLHVLTNMRVMTVSGVFNVVVTECPLRRLARIREVTVLSERVVLAGSLELIPMDESFAIMLWQTIRTPAEVYRKIQAAIGRTR